MLGAARRRCSRSRRRTCRAWAKSRQRRPSSSFAVAPSILPPGSSSVCCRRSRRARSPAPDSLARHAAHDDASPARQRVRSALIVAEVAFAMALTVGAGLLLRSFVTVLGVDPGFEADRLLTFQMSVPSRFTVSRRRGRVLRRARSAAARAAGCDARRRHHATAARQHERDDATSTSKGATRPGRSCRKSSSAAPSSTTSARWAFRYCADALFTREDTARHADGRRRQHRARRAGLSRRGGDRPERPHRRIERAVADDRRRRRQHQARAASRKCRRPEIYITHRQGPPVSPFLALRTSGDPGALGPAIRQAIRDVGADPPTDVRTMEQIRSASVGERRFVLLLVGLFGGVTLAAGRRRRLRRRSRWSPPSARAKSASVWRSARRRCRCSRSSSARRCGSRCRHRAWRGCRARADTAARVAALRRRRSRSGDVRVGGLDARRHRRLRRAGAGAARDADRSGDDAAAVTGRPRGSTA